jgi:hypothetical protein
MSETVSLITSLSHTNTTAVQSTLKSLKQQNVSLADENMNLKKKLRESQNVMLSNVMPSRSTFVPKLETIYEDDEEMDVDTDVDVDMELDGLLDMLVQVRECLEECLCEE